MQVFTAGSRENNFPGVEFNNIYDNLKIIWVTFINYFIVVVKMQIQNSFVHHTNECVVCTKF